MYPLGPENLGLPVAEIKQRVHDAQDAVELVISRASGPSSCRGAETETRHRGGTGYET